MSTQEDDQAEYIRQQMQEDQRQEMLAELAAERAALIADGICPVCGGDGVWLGDNYGWTGAPREYRCTDCRGTGRYHPSDEEQN